MHILRVRAVGGLTQQIGCSMRDAGAAFRDRPIREYENCTGIQSSRMPIMNDALLSVESAL